MKKINFENTFKCLKTVFTSSVNVAFSGEEIKGGKDWQVRCDDDVDSELKENKCGAHEGPTLAVKHLDTYSKCKAMAENVVLDANDKLTANQMDRLSTCVLRYVFPSCLKHDFHIKN